MGARVEVGTTARAWDPGPGSEDGTGVAGKGGSRGSGRCGRVWARSKPPAWVSGGGAGRKVRPGLA